MGGRKRAKACTIAFRAWVCLPAKATINSSGKSSMDSFSRAKASFHSRLWTASSRSLGGAWTPIVNILQNEFWEDVREQGRGTTPSLDKEPGIPCCPSTLREPKAGSETSFGHKVTALVPLAHGQASLQAATKGQGDLLPHPVSTGCCI